MLTSFLLLLVVVVVVVVWCAVRALVAIRAALVDPNRVLRDWDVDAGGDPCAWPMVTCNQGRVYQLYASPPCSVHARLCAYLECGLMHGCSLRFLFAGL